MLIEFEDVEVVRPHGPVLQGVDLRLQEARIGVVGPNGAGKSTLARLLNGLVLPSAGQVRVDGRDTRRQTDAVRREVGFLFQNPDNQIVFPIVREDLAFGLKRREPDPAARAARVQAQLEALGIGALADRASHSLSGGEKQLVALAAVLVLRPRLLVFDEPTTQLDLRHRNRLAALLAQLPQQAIVVSHDLDLLAGFDRVIAVVDGRVAADDTPGEALAWYRRQCG